MPRAYSMANRAQARENTRQRLMSAATDLMIERGSTDLAIAAVAERADLAVRTVYNHFASLNELLAAAMTAIRDEFAEMAPEPVDEHGQTPASALRVLVGQWFGELARNDARLSALLSIRGSTELERAFEDARQLRLTRVRSVLAMAEARGELRVPLADAVAMAYVATGYQSWVALVRQLGLTTDAAADLVTESVTAFALGSPPPRS